MDYQKIIDDLSISVLESVKKAIENHSKSDKTFKAKVTEKINDGKYSVMYCGNSYTVSSHLLLEIGDYVRVCAPCNNWLDLFVVCKTK